MLEPEQKNVPVDAAEQHIQMVFIALAGAGNVGEGPSRAVRQFLGGGRVGVLVYPEMCQRSEKYSLFSFSHQKLFTT